MNNRELVTVMLLSALVLWIIVYPKTRSSVPQLLRLSFSPKIIGSLLIYAIGLSALVWMAWRIDLWTSELLVDTIFWFFLTGLAWFFNIGKAGREAHFVRDRVVKTLGVAAFFEFFINLKPLALGWELLLQISLIFLLMLQGVARSKPAFRPVKRLVDILLLLIVLGLVIHTVSVFVGSWQSEDPALLARKLALPIWLTLASVPFIYAVALWAGYELILTHASFMNERQRPGLKPLMGIISALRGNLLDINQFRGHHLRTAVRSGSYHVARAEVAAFKAERQADRRDRAAARERLINFAGVDGIDEHGRRLNRQEFAETKAALEWLANCHMGWYRRGGSYRPDLLEVLGDFKRQGLPAQHGIKMQVSKDGQAWYAYRRTATGWYFAIGASGEPPNQWLYDGAEKPHSFPEGGTAWIDNHTDSPTEWLPEGET